jgi:soluble lytic murein transglycosylase-like protein
MRVLLLALTLASGVFMVSYSVDTRAGSTPKKMKHGGLLNQKLLAGHGKRGKGNAALLQARRVYRPTDVWERIRLGMQGRSFDGLQPSSAPFSNTLASDIDQLLKSSAVQVRLYKFQHIKTDALKQVLKSPAEIGTHYKGNASLALSIGHTPVRSAEYHLPKPAPESDCQPTNPDTPGLVQAKHPLKKSAPGFIQVGYSVPLRHGYLAIPPHDAQPCAETESTTDVIQQFAAHKPAEPSNHPAAASSADSAYARINKQVDWFTKRPDYLRHVSERARPYLYHIVEALGRNKMPLELALLPIVESAYQPTAQSPKSAAGLWQFIPSTGKEFNLKQDDVYDERLDISASTQAAIRFLSQLNRHFKGDWLLALAAYNAGQGRVDSAIRQNVAQGLPTDYWSLPLPEETKNYVPRLLALVTIFSNPGHYRVNVKPIKNEPYFVQVAINRSVEMVQLAKKDLRTVAELADLSYEQFTQLNPGYVRGVLAENGPYRFVMPAANANRLQQQVTQLASAASEEPRPDSPFLQAAYQGKTGGLGTSESPAETLLIEREFGVEPI